VHISGVTGATGPQSVSLTPRSAMTCSTIGSRIKVTYKGESKTIRERLLTDHTVSAIRSLVNNASRIDCGDSA